MHVFLLTLWIKYQAAQAIYIWLAICLRNGKTLNTKMGRRKLQDVAIQLAITKNKQNCVDPRSNYVMNRRSIFIYFNLNEYFFKIWGKDSSQGWLWVKVVWGFNVSVSVWFARVFFVDKHLTTRQGVGWSRFKPFWCKMSAKMIQLKFELCFLSP